MNDATPARCRYSAAGHMKHPIQYKLAFRAGDPVVVQIVGEHDLGVLVAPVDNPDHVEEWCMHQQWRDVIHAAMGSGITTMLKYKHALARIGDEYISYVSREYWRECPRPQEMKPWERGFVSREEISRAADAPPDKDQDHT